MASDIRKILAENVEAIIGTESNPTRWASGKSTERKRALRLKGADHAPKLTTLEWFAKAAGVATWELLVEGFDPKRRPQLLAHDVEIAGLTPDELRLIRKIRAGGANKLRAALELLDVPGGQDEVGAESGQGLGGSTASHGSDQRRVRG